MAKTPGGSRGERIRAFFRRLAAAPPASDHDEAMRPVADILNAVEDEMPRSLTIPPSP